jgi:hypothetical protein
MLAKMGSGVFAVASGRANEVGREGVGSGGSAGAGLGGGGAGDGGVDLGLVSMVTPVLGL